MTPQGRQRLKNLLVSNEKYEQFPYVDTTGHLTVGIGRNLSDRGISPDEALALLDDDINYFNSKLNSLLSFFSGLDEPRQIVLIDMCFNLGVHGFLDFHRMLDAIENEDWEKAAEEILNSKAADQCPDRYKQLANIMKTGEL